MPDPRTGRVRVAVLISGAGSNMAALIDAAGQVDAPFEVVLVLSNKAEAGGLVIAQGKGVAVAVVDLAYLLPANGVLDRLKAGGATITSPPD